MYVNLSCLIVRACMCVCVYTRRRSSSTYRDIPLRLGTFWFTGQLNCAEATADARYVALQKSTRHPRLAKPFPDNEAATDTSARQSIGFRSHEDTAPRVTVRSVRVNPYMRRRRRKRRKREKTAGGKEKCTNAYKRYIYASKAQRTNTYTNTTYRPRAHIYTRAHMHDADRAE